MVQERIITSMVEYAAAQSNINIVGKLANSCFVRMCECSRFGHMLKALASASRNASLVICGQKRECKTSKAA